MIGPGAVEVVSFQSSHLLALNLQVAQRKFNDEFMPDHARALEMAGNAYTAMDGGVPIACSGVVEQWEGRALAWAMLADDIGGQRFVRVHRAVRRFIDVAPYRRIEMQVDAEHAPAIRWARMLGFEVESKMRAFLPNGRDAFMFVRIR